MKQGMSDKETLLMLVTMMADRHAHLERAYRDLLARMPDPYLSIPSDYEPPIRMTDAELFAMLGVPADVLRE